MNNNIQSAINNFFDNIHIAENNLNTFSKTISTKDKTIHSIIQEFNIFLNNIVIEDEKSEFNVQLKETLDQYKTKSEMWKNWIDIYIDGKEFINQFEKSLLFVVFGNVNVGKSSLGNFIAGVPEQLREYYKEIPDFYVYDYAKSNSNSQAVKLNEPGFKVNDTEETTSIQYYTLNNGLTWVDSPGIHSINGENEELAKKYVDYADLVIFVTSSSSPAKHDEFLEISRLINKQKPILVVINKSDKKDYDEIDGAIVSNLIAKSELDRNSQEKYVKDTFSNSQDIKYAKSIDSISISTYLAEKGLKEDDNNIFASSGIPRFYDGLGDVLKNNALDLKKQAPIQRINSLIEEVLNGFSLNDNKIEGIISMKSSFNNILLKIDKSINEINLLKTDFVKEVRVKSMPEIDLSISRKSLELQSGEKVEEIKEIVEEIVLNNFNHTIQKQVSKLLNDFKYSNVDSLNLNINPKLEAKYETISYTEYSVKEIKRDPKGILENIGALFGKEYTKIKTSTHKVDKQVIVGDNSSEVIENIINILEQELNPIATKILMEISDGYFSKEKELVVLIIQKLNEIQQKLIREKI